MVSPRLGLEYDLCDIRECVHGGSGVLAADLLRCDGPNDPADSYSLIYRSLGEMARLEDAADLGIPSHIPPRPQDSHA